MVVLALQAADVAHLEVDNLNVVRHVGRLIDGNPQSCSVELLKDGDFILLIDRMLGKVAGVRFVLARSRGLQMRVWLGMVRFLGSIGLAMILLMGVAPSINLFGVCNRWFPESLSLHRFFIAICRAAVNHVDGVGNALDPLGWWGGGLPKRCRLIHAVRDRTFLPGLAHFGALVRSLCPLPGGLGRFVPCTIGANHCGLRHIGSEKCGHEPSSRPREAASVRFLNDLVLLFLAPSRACCCPFTGYLASSELCHQVCLCGSYLEVTP